ncbi:MAG: type VI secretion system baseplate subunit TssE [Ideonella sp. MAG2]|nr:MAG: type VI secretion system baseplate subunit TssE [Ideonella sp. MAG2]
MSRTHPLHPAARPPLDEQARADARAVEHRYLPTLFDRLCDDAPSERSEAPGAYVPDRQRMREILQRDLSLLLNTLNHDSTLGLHRYPQVAASCVNYGMPPMAGQTLSERQWADIEQAVRLAITRFEPRIVPDTLVVRPLQKSTGKQSAHLLNFEISGQVYMLPYPLEFMVQSTADLEAMRMELREAKQT